MYAAVASSIPNQSGRSRRMDSQSRERSAGPSTATTSTRGAALRAIDPAGGLNGGGDLDRLAVRERPAVEQEPPVAHDPDDRRLAEPQREREPLLHRAGSALDLGERQRPAADAGHRLLDLAAACGCEAIRSLADALDRLVEHPQDRRLPEARVEHRRERALERGEPEPVRTKRAL